MATSILVVEDHPVVLEGLSGLLQREGGFVVVARASTAPDARTAVLKHAPEVVLLDLVLQDHDGITLIRELTDIAPRSRILVFSLQPEDIYAERCLRAGAHGYVMKQEPMSALYDAIRTVTAGGVRVGTRVAAAAVAGLRRPAGTSSRAGEAGLTDRELQVYRLTGLGISTRDVAGKLGISVKTVEAHRENIKNKLGVDSHSALVSRAANWVASA